MSDTLALRRELGTLLVDSLRAEIPGISAHVGEDYETGNEPEAILYRQIGAHFRWVAFTFAPWRSWDLHVGVVEIESNVLSIGCHISERAKDSMLSKLTMLATSLGLATEHRPRVIEYQANLPPFDLAHSNKSELIGAISALCRAFAPVAASVTPPSSMRAL